MAYRIEGEINIPLEDFWEFVSQYTPKGVGEVMYGVPHIDPNNLYDLKVNFVANTECHPSNESKPNIPQQEWQALTLEG